MNVISRVETKYELKPREAAVLSLIVAGHLPCFEYVKGHAITWVTTVYFDTERLDFFRRAVRSHERNLKVRVREYSYRGPNGEVILYPECFLEIKRRLGEGRVVKQRLGLPKTLLGRLLDGEDIWALLAGNGNGAALAERRVIYDEVRRFLTGYALEPRSVVQYRRKVYQVEERDLRITFDDELTIHYPSGRPYERSESLLSPDANHACRRLENVIVEV